MAHQVVAGSPAHPFSGSALLCIIGQIVKMINDADKWLIK